MKRAPTNFYLSLSPYPRADTTTMSLDSTRDSSYAQIPRPRVEGQGSSLSENRQRVANNPFSCQTDVDMMGKFRKPCSAQWRTRNDGTREKISARLHASNSQQRQPVGGSSSVDNEEGTRCKILSGRFKRRWMKGERGSYSFVYVACHSAGRALCLSV